MKKITILAAILTVISVYNCSQEESEVYSCDEKLNEWAHKNIRAIRSMDREAWMQLDEQYKHPAFNALTPEQKLLFWKNKLTEVMTSFDWNTAEMEHLMILYKYFEEHPDLYTEESMNDSIANDHFARFCYRWKNDAMIDLDWTEEQIYAIACTGNRMISKDGDYEIIQRKRNTTTTETTKSPACDCSTKRDKNCKGGGCAPFKAGIGYAEYLIDGIKHEK